MSTAIAGVRAHIATALGSLGVPVHTYPEGGVQPPCALLLPGSPYRDPGTGWDTVSVGIDVRIVVNDGAGLDAQATLDSLIDAACDALTSAGVEVGQVPAPVPEPEQAAITCDIPTSTVWKDD
jgi:hypothetical protein